MKRTLLISLMCAALVCVFALPSLWAVDAPGGEIILKAPAGAKATKAPVAFTHANHKQDCKVCHHKWDGSGAVKGCSAEGCHVDASKAAKKDPKGFYQAWHAKGSKSCVGCHKTEKKGPTKCTECHPKK